MTVDGTPAEVLLRAAHLPRAIPLGPEDPDPRAHEASQTVPVGGPQDEPSAARLQPELPTEGGSVESRDGTQCPATSC